MMATMSKRSERHARKQEFIARMVAAFIRVHDIGGMKALKDELQSRVKFYPQQADLIRAAYKRVHEVAVKVV